MAVSRLRSIPRHCVRLLFSRTPGLHAGNDERVDDVPELPCEGPVQVLEDGTHHVLRGGLAGDFINRLSATARVPKSK